MFYGGIPVGMGLLLGSARAGVANFLPWEFAVLYWLVLALGMWLLADLCTRVAALLLRPWRPPTLALLVIGFFIASALARPPIYAFTKLLEPYMLNGRTARPLPPVHLDLNFILEHLRLWSGICVVWVGLNYLFDRYVGLPRFRYDLEGMRSAPGNAPLAPGGGAGSSSDGATALGRRGAATTVPIGTSAFVARLPLHLGTKLVALKAEDHYVLTYTEAGKALVLYRLSDAINELQGYRGLRVHRSWWINIDAVEHVETSPRGPCVVLHGGLRVPISASFRDAARSAGLVSAGA
jgi:hypothetical protein